MIDTHNTYIEVPVSFEIEHYPEERATYHCPGSPAETFVTERHINGYPVHDYYYVSEAALRVLKRDNPVIYSFIKSLPTLGQNLKEILDEAEDIAIDQWQEDQIAGSEYIADQRAEAIMEERKLRGAA